MSTTGPPEPPCHLSDDAKSKWCQSWPQLDRNRRDASGDREALALYCEAWADIRRVDREIEQLEQITKMNTDSAAPEQGSKELHEQRLAAMERFDSAAEKLGLSLYALQYSAWGDYSSTLMELPQELSARDEKQTNPAVPGQPRIWTFKRVWAALQRSCGNMAAAARLLSETYGVTCARATIFRLVNKYPQLREAIEDSELTLLDLCHAAIFKRALAGDEAAQEFVLCTFDPRFQQ